MVDIELGICEDVFAVFFSGVLECSLDLEECLVAGQLKMYLMMRPKCSADLVRDNKQATQKETPNDKNL
jgi:hypothetical protein